MGEIFNSREIALAIWLLVILIIFLSQRTIRSGVKSVLGAFFVPKLFIPFLLSFLLPFIVILVLAHFNLWDLSILKETIYWTIGTGIVMFMNSMKTKDAKTLLTATAKDTLKLIIILEFLVNFYVFPIWVELLLIPFTTLLVILSTVAGFKKGKEYEPTRKLLSGLTTIVGILVLFFAILAFIQEPKPLFTIQNLEIFLLPIILSFAYAPSVYLIALWSKYELVFLRIDMPLAHIKNRRAIKLAALKRGGLNIKIAGEMIRYLVMNLDNRTTETQAIKLIRDFKLPKQTDVHS